MGRRVVLVLTAMAATLVLAGGMASPAGAAEFTVSNTNDQGAGSLRQAIADANASPADDTIVFAPEVQGTIDLQSPLQALGANGKVIIQGPGADKLTVQRDVAPGTPPFGIFTVNPQTTAEISGLTITNGHAGQGGGISNFAGTLTLKNSTLSNNRADFQGGGISNDSGTVTVEGSTLSGNVASFEGGGIYTGNGTLTLRNSTLSGNSASGPNSYGGGIANFGALTVAGSTLSGNSAAGFQGGGGIFTGNGTLTLRSSIVAGNTAPPGGGPPDVHGPLTEDRFNLIGTTAAGAGLEVDGQGKPLLKDNGGPTKTIALQPGSSAIDKGNSFGLTTDQRGKTRPKDFNNIPNATDGDGSDIGAFELHESGVSISDTTIAEGDSGTTNATFTVSLSPASDQTVTVDYATSDGTATSGSDYGTTSGTLTFAPNDTSETITVPINGDTTDEPDETFSVNLSNASGAAITDGEGVGTITNDDAPLSLSVGDATITEGDSGTTNASFTVTLSEASGQEVTVNYATANGTATAGPDYQSSSGSLTFAAGETTKTVTVPVNGDTTDELDETFSVNLSSASGATIKDGEGVGTISDDDAEPSLSVGDATVAEGDSGTTNASFTVTLSEASERQVTVDYATVSGTASSVSDYVASSGTLTFAAGDTSETIAVPVNGDTKDESKETFYVGLSNASGATISDRTGIGTINDDDAVPSVSVGDATITEGDSGTTNASFTVTLSEASGRYVTMDYATADDTAISGSDYVSTSGRLTFFPGHTSKTVTVQVRGDTTDEPDETFYVYLIGASSATIDDDEGIGTITDQDTDTAAPTVLESSLTPPRNQTGVPRNTPIEAIFAEEMSADTLRDADTLTSTTVKLAVYNKKKRKWQPVRDVSVSCNSPCTKVTLTPANPLLANKKYMVTIEGAEDTDDLAVEDLPGNALAKDFAWTFTTGRT